MKEVLEKVANYVQESVRKPIVPDTFEANWAHEVLVLSNPVAKKVMLPIKCEMRLLKKDGTPAARYHTETTHVAMTYCPFCGGKLTSDDKEDQQ